MLVSALAFGLFASGSPVLVALADPCIPAGSHIAPISAPNATPPPGAPAVSPTPNAFTGTTPYATLAPIAATPVPTAGPHQAQQLSSYPVFAPSENLAAPTSSPTPTPLPALTPAPSATPSLPPCPTHTHRLFGAGPILFSGTGSISAGAHGTSGEQNGLPDISQTQTTDTLGLELQASRRTDQSSLTISAAVGLSANSATAAGVDVAYSTPKYIINYGQVGGPADTQLSSGSFSEGITFGVPRGREEWDVIVARTSGVNGETFRVGALRHTHTFPKGALLSETFFQAFGEQGGTSSTLDTAFTEFTQSNSLRLELALSAAHNVQTVTDGTRVAYGFSDDVTGKVASTNISYSAIPYGYAALGEVQYAQDQFQFTTRRPFFNHSAYTYSFNETSSNENGESSQTSTNILSFNYAFSHKVNSQWLADYSTSLSNGQVSHQAQYSLGLSEQAFGSNLQESLTSGVTHDTLSGTSYESDISASFSKQIAAGFLTLQTETERNSTAGTVTSQAENLASYTRSVGRKTQVTLSAETLTSNAFGAGAEATKEFLTTYSATRQLSPVIGLHVDYTKTHQSGTYGGKSSSFDFDIVGPLAIGTAARYNGRANPNLPASIQGHVFLESQSSAYGLLGNRGYPNVLVTLDGGITQRTDASGSYAFTFVRPGPHIVSIALGTLPVGTIPDASSQSLTVQGGQTALVDFAVGQFAGVGGTVTEMVNGKAVPIPGVLINVDDKYRGYSGVDGTYEVGHLGSGSHSVTIDDSTLPATLSVVGDQTRKIDVNSGQVSPLDWQLVGLGSISGQVLFTDNAGFGELTPAPNVYVVADPGEHASITGVDGTFVLDNLPPGTYTLSLDSDTLPDGQVVTQGPDGPVVVEGGESVQGISFKVGAQAKMVVIGFGGKNASVNVSFRPEKVPSLSTAEIIVTTSEEHARSVIAQSDLFGSLPLHFDKALRAWVATFVVPPVSNQDFQVHVDVTGPKNGSSDTAITVDNAIPLIVAHGAPSSPKPGQPVHVIMKSIAAGVEPGELVTLEDGQTFKLPPPHGKIYVFDVTVKHALPYRALLFTRKGVRLPFVIQP